MPVHFTVRGWFSCKVRLLKRRTPVWDVTKTKQVMFLEYSDDGANWFVLARSTILDEENIVGDIWLVTVPTHIAQAYKWESVE